MPSTVTRTMAVRLPVDAADRVEKSAKRQGVSVSEYLRKIVMRQVGRKR